MNEAAANALYDAERKGVRQIKFALEDGAGGFCAGGVLRQACIDGALVDFGMSETMSQCPLCGSTKHDNGYQHLVGEWGVMVHLNNDHGLTFSEIARKLGPDAA